MIKFPVVSRDTLFIVPSLCQSVFELELQKVEGVNSLPFLSLDWGHLKRCYAGNARIQSLSGELYSYSYAVSEM